MVGGGEVDSEHEDLGATRKECGVGANGCGVGEETIERGDFEWSFAADSDAVCSRWRFVGRR